MLPPEERDFFEEHLQTVLAELPPLVKDLIRQIPLIVDDYPSKGLAKKLNLAHRGDLCGLYVGVSLDRKSVEHAGNPSDTVYLFRDGILNAAADDHGDVTPERLRDEIRRTILHEYGHHHGLDEEELEDLGY
jgi:predicted Zn-dependent protease with MMP-like domain